MGNGEWLKGERGGSKGLLDCGCVTVWVCMCTCEHVWMGRDRIEIYM